MALFPSSLAKGGSCGEFAGRMQILRKMLADRRVIAAVAFLVFAVALAGVVAWRMGVGLDDLKAWWGVTESYLKENPWALFLALVILPGLPVPTTALLLTAGVVWRHQPVMACLLCLFALILNLTWTYWLAAGVGRNTVEKLLAATSIKIPDLPRGDHLKLILVLKLTPGIPLFLQNYLLGFLRAPFSLYLPLSILCNGVIGIGVVLSGAGLSNGKLMPALTGVSLVVLGAVLTHFVRGWLARGKAEKVKS
jgi:uncharacterized membrane protein YdjX (TVP38/TMEM64 family)